MRAFKERPYGVGGNSQPCALGAEVLFFVCRGGYQPPVLTVCYFAGG